MSPVAYFNLLACGFAAGALLYTGPRRCHLSRLELSFWAIVNAACFVLFATGVL